MSEREEPEPSRGIQRQRAASAALVEEEPSSTPVVPIAPQPARDFISRSPVFDLAGRVNVIWESSRVDDVGQVFATRWNVADAETAIPTDTAPRQITAGSAAHRYPAVVVLPGGDLVVAYETAREDVYFKRGPFERLATAAERPVATSQREMEKFPFVVRSGVRLVFFWMSADRHDHIPHAKSKRPAVVVDGDRAVWVFWQAGERIFSQRFRRDLDPPQWAENVTPVPGAATGSDVTPAAVRDAAGVIWLFWSRYRPDPDAARDQFVELVDLYLVRHYPVTGWGEPFRVSASPFSGFGPVPVLAPGGRIWLFWSDANGGDSQGDLFFKQLGTSI